MNKVVEFSGKEIAEKLNIYVPENRPSVNLLIQWLSTVDEKVSVAHVYGNSKSSQFIAISRNYLDTDYMYKITSTTNLNYVGDEIDVIDALKIFLTNSPTIVAVKKDQSSAQYHFNYTNPFTSAKI